VLGALAEELHHVAPIERVDALTTEAVAVARQVGDPLTLARALSTQHMALWRASLLERRTATAAELAQLATQGRLTADLESLAHVTRAGVGLARRVRASH
jgi:hypothetical protein